MQLKQVLILDEKKKHSVLYKAKPGELNNLIMTSAYVVNAALPDASRPPREITLTLDVAEAQ